MKEYAEAVVRTVGERLLYARVDFLRLSPGVFELMELEIIEPCLFLSICPGSGRRFGEAIVEYLDNST